MYYDNKSTFYIKQYGPAAFTIALSLVLVVGGLYIYLSSNKNNNPQDTLVAKNDTQSEQQVEQSNSLQDVKEDNVSNSTPNVVEEKKDVNININQNVSNTTNASEVKSSVNINDVKITNVLSAELRALNKLEKSKELTVVGVDDNKNIIINANDKNYKASLIGIDYKKSGLDIKDKLNSDLANKKVTIAFDNVKVQDNTLCVYLYVDGNLYNQKLLKDGLAILNVEKANTSLLNELVNAQKQAKTNNIGIRQNKKHAELGKNLSFHISTSYDRLYSNIGASIFLF